LSGSKLDSGSRPAALSHAQGRPIVRPLITGLVLIARGDGTKDIEILVQNRHRPRRSLSHPPLTPPRDPIDATKRHLKRL
jgi:hypothetical protein